MSPGPLVTATPLISGALGSRPALIESAAHDGTNCRDVGAASQLGNDAAKGAVLVDRGLDDRGVNTKLFVDDGGGRLVTTRLDAQD